MTETFTADEIIQKVMEYSGGCDDGKKEFLKRQFGLTVPKKPIKNRYVLEVVSHSEFDIDPATIARVLKNGFAAEQAEYKNEHLGDKWWGDYFPIEIVVSNEDENVFENATVDSGTKLGRFM